jgi:hypothetical protein
LFPFYFQYLSIFRIYQHHLFSFSTFSALISEAAPLIDAF